MGKAIFTPEQKEVVISKMETEKSGEILKYINEELGIKFTAKQFKQWRTNHKVKLKVRTNYWLGKCWIPEEHIQFIKDHVHEYEAPTLAAKLNEMYGTSYTTKQIKTFKNNHGVKGYQGTGGWNENRPNPHKGEKGWSVPNSEATRFKKGCKIWNEAEILEERKTTDGYWKVKLGERDWKFKHKLIWEAANGPIPKGMMVTFLDNNKDNLDLSNLALISNNENGALHKYRKACNADLTQAGLLVTRIKNKITDRKEENGND